MSRTEKRDELLRMAAEYRKRAQLNRGKADVWSARAANFDRDAETLERLAREV